MTTDAFEKTTNVSSRGFRCWTKQVGSGSTATVETGPASQGVQMTILEACADDGTTRNMKYDPYDNIAGQGTTVESNRQACQERC